MKQRIPSGFTLLEVLIALGVLAIALGAIIQAIGSATANTTYLRDKTFAHWVAMNQVAELQASQAFPPIGTEKGSEVMANHEWFWQREVNETPGREEIANRSRQVVIEVRRNKNDEKPLVSVMTFVAKSI
ncbi:MAG TPA: type II secretion system protein GspI [Gammaproteobacteria bacterium]|nr:type II secretion system protein GspI [Gammaproteobacteria bacterium]